MSGPRLVVWGGGSAAAARELTDCSDGPLLAWPASDTAALRQAGLPFRRAEEVLGAEGLLACSAAGRGWARVWARLPLDGTRSFRDLASWRGESLLWTCEGFLAAATAGPRCAAAVERCLLLLDALHPAEIDACGLAAHEALLLARAATARGILFHDAPRGSRPLAVQPVPRAPGAVRRFLGRAHLRAAAGERRPLVLLGGCAPTALESGAQGEPARVVSIAELWRFETRAVRRTQARLEAELRQLKRSLSDSAALAASYAHRGVGFADLAAGDLDALLCRFLPEAGRQLERACALLERVQAPLVAVVSEDRDERRLVGLAASACGVPWGVLHCGDAGAAEPARSDGGPQPAFVEKLTAAAEAACAAARLADVFCCAGAAGA